MSNFLLEFGLSFATLMGAERVLKMYKINGKVHTFLSVTIAVIIFTYLPYIFNNDGYPMTFNDEEVGDRISSTVRGYLGIIFLFFFGIYLAIN